MPLDLTSNLISEAIGILVTVFFVDRLIAWRAARRWRMVRAILFERIHSHFEDIFSELDNCLNGYLSLPAAEKVLNEYPSLYDEWRERTYGYYLRKHLGTNEDQSTGVGHLDDFVEWSTPFQILEFRQFIAGLLQRIEEANTGIRYKRVMRLKTKIWTNEIGERLKLKERIAPPVRQLTNTTLEFGERVDSGLLTIVLHLKRLLDSYERREGDSRTLPLSTRRSAEIDPLGLSYFIKYTLQLSYYLRINGVDLAFGVLPEDIDEPESYERTARLKLRVASYYGAAKLRVRYLYNVLRDRY